MADLSILLLKIANNEKLSPQDMADLAQFGTETQRTNSIIAKNTGADSNQNLSSPTIQNPSWLSSPLKMAAYKYSATVPNLGEYAQVTDSVNSAEFKMNSADEIEFSCENFLVAGQINFDNSFTTAGQREVTIIFYNKSGTELYRFPLVNMDASLDAAYTATSFCFMYNDFLYKKIDPTADASKFDFLVYQNSGIGVVYAMRIGVVQT